MHSLTAELLHSALRLQERLETLLNNRVDLLEEKLEAADDVSVTDFRTLRQLSQLCASQTRLCAQLSRQVDRQLREEAREEAREQAREARQQEKAAEAAPPQKAAPALPLAHSLPTMPPQGVAATAPRVGAAPQPAHVPRH